MLCLAEVSPFFSTPLRQGGREFPLGTSGGGYNRPALGSAYTQGGRSDGSVSSQGSGSQGEKLRSSLLLQATFFTSEQWTSRCCGFIGSTGKFCIEKKVAPLGHCGTMSHGNGRKFSPVNNTYYAPAGVHYGRQAAESELHIDVDCIPSKWRERIDSGWFTRAKWVDIFHEVMSDSVFAERGPASTSANAYRAQLPQSHEFGADRSLGSYSEDVQTQRFEIPYPWEADDGMEMGESLSADQLKAFDDIRRVVLQGYNEIRELQASNQARIEMEVAEQLGDMNQHLNRHGSFEKAIESMMRPVVGPVDKRINDVRAEVQKAFTDSEADASDSRDELMKMIRKIVEATTLRATKDERRFQALELAVRSGRGSSSMGGAQAPSTVAADTTMTVVDVGGNQVTVSFNHMFQRMREMEAKVEVLLERAKNVGVLFACWGFPSESEFALFHARENPGSTGLAAFVDITSIWGAFGQAGTPDTTEFLNTAHRAKSVGLKGGEAEYAVSFQVRYPSVFVGAAKEVLSTTIIHVFKSYEDWQGNGHDGDGVKDRLARMMAQAVECHKQYVEDAGFTGELRELALRTAEETSRWWYELVNYIDGEFLTLTSYKLSPKNILLLLSNQFVSILDDIYEYRCKAGRVDLVGNHQSACIRFAWVTLQSHVVMASFREDKFRNHKSIAGTFTRFLTRNMADQSALGLKSKVDGMDSDIKKLLKEIKEKATMEAHNKLDSKVQGLSRTPTPRT